MQMYHHTAAVLASVVAYVRSPPCSERLHIDRTFLPIKAVYFLVFGANVCLFPYLSVYMTYLGLSATQVGIIRAVNPFANLVMGTLLGMVVDKFSIHRVFLMLGILAPTVIFSSLYFVPHVKQFIPWIPMQNISDSSNLVIVTDKWLLPHLNATLHSFTNSSVNPTPKPVTNSVITFWLMLLILFVGRTFSTPFTTIMDASTQKLAHERGTEFGRQRLWGAVAWGIWSPIAGAAIDSFQPNSILTNEYSLVFIMYAGLMLLTMIPLCMIKLPPHERPQSLSRNIGSLFVKPLFIMFIISVSVCGFVLGVISTYLFIFLEDDLDSPHYLMGLTLTFTCISEVPFMFFAKKILDIMSHMNVLNLVLFTWGVRLFLYTILQSPYWVLPIELLHGITFGLFYPTFTSFINWISPEGLQTTVQAISTAILTGVGFGSGMLAGGVIYDTYGGRNLFRASAVMCFGTCVAMVITQFVLRRRTVTELSVQYEPI